MASVSIKDFFSKKNIFITGGTGFVGISLIEKLLRSVPEIGTIYLLMRPKRGKAIEERLLEIKENSVFEKLKQESSEEQFIKLFSKLHAIAGEIGEPNLGISPADRQLLCDEANVVFHSAATLDFEASLRPTVQINLLGTRQITELCVEIKNLSCLVHVSSAYVNSFLLHAEEKIYPLPEDPEKVIKLVAELSDDKLQEMTPDLLKDHPNTYTFTKHLAEHEVKKFETRYPCAIVRPSMICGAWREPIPGWTISKNGPQGFVMGAMMGVVRRLPMPVDTICDYIPVDIVINTLLAAACHTATNKSSQVEIYQATSSTRKPFKWNLVENKINGFLHRYPSKSAIWYPHLRLLPTYTWFKISSLFVHMFPAIILDGLLKVTGGRAKVTKLHRNINKSLDLLQKFVFTEWTFTAVKTDDLQQWLLKDDKESFGVSIEMLDWRDYFINLCRGVRTYLCKESERSLPAAKNKDNMLLVAHIALQAGLYTLLWFATSCLLGSTMAKTALVLPLIYFMFSLV